jgi:hypothetical protein
MSDMEERARRLVDAARPGHNPTGADAARVRAALKARVLAEPLLIQPGPAQAAASGGLGKLLVAVGVGSALGFAAGLYAAQAFWPGMLARPADAGAVSVAAAAGMNDASRTGGATEPARPLASGSTREAAGSARVRVDGVEAADAEGVPSMPQSATSIVESPPLVPPRAPPRASTSTARASSAPAVSPIKAELDGLRRAQEQLYQGRPAWAIARLDELDRAGVGSVLLEERAATRAIAECRLGVAGAGASDDYARRFPRSAHLERVQASCSGAPQGGAAAPGGGTSAQKVTPVQTESRGSQHEE